MHKTKEVSISYRSVLGFDYKARFMSNKCSDVYFQENKLQLQYHIALEFLKLHQFLHGKEKMLIKQLKEESEMLFQEMEANLNKLQDLSQNAKDILGRIQSRLYQRNSVGFLKVSNLDLTG